MDWEALNREVRVVVLPTAGQQLGSCWRGFCDDLSLNFFELKMCKYSYAATKESTASVRHVWISCLRYEVSA